MTRSKSELRIYKTCVINNEKDDEKDRNENTRTIKDDTFKDRIRSQDIREELEIQTMWKGCQMPDGQTGPCQNQTQRDRWADHPRDDTKAGAQPHRKSYEEG